MKEKAKNKQGDEMEIKIDYSNLNVEDIMAQIKERLAEQIEASEGDVRISDLPEPEPVAQPPEPSRPAGVKGKIKKILLKIMRPFAPIMKILMLPVYEEFTQTNQTLHQTNIRLDHLNNRVDRAFQELSHQSDTFNSLNVRIGEILASMEQGFEEFKNNMNNLNQRIESQVESVNKRIDKKSKTINQRIDRINETTNKRVDYISDLVNEKLDKLFRDFNRSADFAKLLHNLSHNIVVEITKLKIEEEHLKLKTRIMEKDFEYLSQKEKVLEEKVFA